MAELAGICWWWSYYRRLGADLFCSKADKEISGSSNLIYNTGSNTLQIAGDGQALINISASAFMEMVQISSE